MNPQANPLPNESARLDMVIDMADAIHTIRTHLEVPTRGPIMGEAPATEAVLLSALDLIVDSVAEVTNQLNRAEKRIAELEAAVTTPAGQRRTHTS